MSMEFFSYEYQSGLPFPSPGDLPNPRTEPTPSALAGCFFISESPGKPSLALATPSLSAHMRVRNCTATQVQSKAGTWSKYMHCPSVEFPGSGMSIPAERGDGERKHIPSTSHGQGKCKNLTVSCEYHHQSRQKSLFK